MLRILFLALGLALVPHFAWSQMAPMNELAPTGKLRVGIAVGLVTSAYWAIKDPATGKPKGVTVDLGAAVAKKLGVPVDYVIYANSGEVTAAGPKGEWDIGFAPIDADRKAVIDFVTPYVLSTSSYLVPAGSSIAGLGDVDRPGVRVVGVQNTATLRASARSLTQTKPVGYRTVEEVRDLLVEGKADAAALGLESLKSLAAKLPGSRILPGHFLATGVGAAVPKNKPAAHAWLDAFMDEARTDGTIRRALDAAGLKDAEVAPAGAKP
jgi:polar amino acid transport system substrate-binding protein